MAKDVYRIVSVRKIGKAIHTADGNVLVSSTVATGPAFPGSHGALDIWATKVNKDGVTLWSRALGGSDQDWFTAAYEMADGGFIIIGRTTSTNGYVTGVTLQRIKEPMT